MWYIFHVIINLIDHPEVIFIKLGMLNSWFIAVRQNEYILYEYKKLEITMK